LKPPSVILRGATVAMLPLAAVCADDARPSAETGDRVTIRIEPRSVEVVGLTPRQIELLKAYDEAGKGWSDLFPVFTGSSARPAGRTMLGTYALTDGGLRFEPRFPLAARQDYGAVFRLDLISPCDGTAAVTRDFHLAEDRPTGRATAVEQVFPTADVLPENLLKFYVRFSAPMSRGAYRHVRLLDSKGAAVDLPFLEIAEELWNPDGTRLTLLFDPGRIKRGVKPREDVGAALKEGETYTLVIDSAWPDADGHPLGAEHRKTFRVGPPDEGQPDLERWKLIPPAAGTPDPLSVRFDEALDHAMLERVLSVQTADGDTVPGTASVEAGEQEWRFRPEGLWTGGRYSLVVETTLEDVAGNSIGRAFEVAADRADEKPAAAVVTIPFTVGVAP